ncbi:unnamed protein product [Owenia fusiformis]|uniref:Apple domain-containing protein n=1 Tax=Owenia fusiformis TaxID=6347 RepID=A0A8S4NBM2_OWEFU|nr:unnamed protein product [Owenia fusiformis]
MNMILPALAVLLLCVAQSNAQYFWVNMPSNTCIKDHNDKTFSSVPDRQACRQKCEDETTFTCRSIDYATSTGQCHLSVSYTGNVQIDAPCDPVFQYSERREPSCWTWSNLDNTCIKGQNIATFTTSSMCECKEKCTNYVPTTCRSVDYKASTQTCYLQAAMGVVEYTPYLDRSFSYPTLTYMYGWAVIPYTNNDINLMEGLHKEIGKRIQTLPKNTPDPVATSLLGWMSVRAEIDCDRLMVLS